MSYEGWKTDGTPYSTGDGTVWIRRHDTLDAFAWLGNCARLNESTEPQGEVTITRKRNPRGGSSVHSVYKGAPGLVTRELVIKRLQHDRKKSDLRNCWWTVDDRIQCGGKDADGWNKWSEITRYCQGTATGRAMPASTWGDEDPTDQLISLPMAFLWVDDLYRIQGEIGSPYAGAGMFTDVTSCQPARCPDTCDDQEDCVVVGVTEDVSGSPKLIVNRYGGDLDQWETPINVTDFGAQDITQVECAGEFVVMVSTGAASVEYTYDLGTNLINVQTTDMASHAPASVDLIDQSFVVVGGANGYIYGSYDAARSWSTLDAGNATTNIISRIMIARDVPQVIYGISSAADVIVKTENGGRTWFTQAPTGTAGALSGLFVVNHRQVYVGTTVGEIFETLDGGQTWTEQVVLDELTTKANTTIRDIVGCGCGDLGLITENSSDDERFFFRNVDNGASGKWEQPEEYEAVTSGKSLNGLTCCGSNHFVAVGGEAATDDLVLLLR